MGAPEKPTIDVPAIRREGKDAMLNGRRMRAPGMEERFTVCPYKDGSIERDNFLRGCIEATFKTPNAGLCLGR